MSKIHDKYRKIGALLAQDAMKEGLPCSWAGIQDLIGEGMLAELHSNYKLPKRLVLKLIGISIHIYNRWESSHREYSGSGFKPDDIAPYKNPSIYLSPLVEIPPEREEAMKRSWHSNADAKKADFGHQG